MSVVEDIKSAPKPSFVLIGLLFVGLVLLVTGVASPVWVTSSMVSSSGDFPVQSYGLWIRCKPAPHYSCEPLPNFISRDFDKYRALLVISAIMAVGGLLLALAFTALPKFRTYKFCVILGCVCFIVVATDLVGIILLAVDFNTTALTSYGRSTKYTFGWGLGVSAAGGAAFLVGAGLVFVTAVCSLRSPPLAMARPV